MDYPSWAPADLVAWHKEANREVDAEHQKTVDALLRPLRAFPRPMLLGPGDKFIFRPTYPLLDRLIFSSDAKSLWEILHRTDSFKMRTGDCHASAPGPAFGYWQICEEIISDWQDDPKQTGREKEQELDQIARKARELSEMISRSSYMRQLQMNDIRLSLDASIPPLTKEELDEGIYRQPAITKEQEMSAVLQGLRKIHSVDKLPTDQEAHAGSLLAGYYHMSVNHVLQQIAAIADQENQYAPVVPRPRSAHAKRQFVARCLKDVHMDIFGSPMWDALALACTLIVDPDHLLTADDVRPICR